MQENFYRVLNKATLFSARKVKNVKKNSKKVLKFAQNILIEYDDSECAGL